MAAKKFLSTFTIIIFVFLICAGVALIQVINTTEARAIAAAKEAAEKGIDIPDSNDNLPSSVFEDFITKPFNVLLLVKDKVGANTDAILLINFDTYNSKISIMSIPRDTMLKTDINKDNDYDNDIINMVYASTGLDIEKTIDIIGYELSCNIKYGGVMKLKAFREIMNQLGRVSFEAPYHMEYNDPYQDLHIYFEPGIHQFDGEDAEKLLRFRKNDEGVESTFVNGSDIQRIEMQQDFMKAVFDQKKNLFYITKIRDIINIVFDNFDTNATTNDIFAFLPEVLKVDLSTIEWLTLPTTDTEDFIHLIPNEELIEEIIKSNFQGTSD